LETQSRQPSTQQRVQLKAIATPTAGDHLPLQRSQIEKRYPTKQHIDVFEWNRRRVRLNHRA